MQFSKMCLLSMTNFISSGTVCGAEFIANNIVELKLKIMAEIHVEPKKQATPAWVWILVGLIIIAAVAFFITRNNKTNETDAVHPTSYIHHHP